MKAVLHLGTEKTGTSTIQQTFAKNRSSLMDQGFYFMRCTGGGNDRKLVAYCHGEDQYEVFHKAQSIDSFEKKMQFESQLVKDFEEEVKSLPSSIHTVIFSSEHFQSRLREESQREKLKALLSRFFDEFVFISYIRPQVDMAASHYSTYLKTRGTKDLSEYMERCYPGNYYFDHWRFLSNWEDSFPGQKFIVRIFDRDFMVGKDIVTDTCRAIGIDESKLENINDANESVQPTGQELLRIINSKMPVDNHDGEVNFQRNAIVKMVNKIYAGAGKRPDKSQAIKLQDGFSGINEKVRKRWFPERKELFSIKYEKFDKSNTVQWDVVSFFDLLLSEINALNPGKMAGVSPDKVDKIRDAAVYLEKHNIEIAHDVMLVAMKLRPSGTFIKKKALEYEKSVNSDKFYKKGAGNYYLSNEFRVKRYFDDAANFVYNKSFQKLGSDFIKGKPFLFNLEKVESYYRDFSSHYVDDMISFMETVNAEDPVPLVAGDAFLKGDMPAFVKSRKINGRGMLLKLNSKRHWVFDLHLDTTSWENKINKIIWRGAYTGRVGEASQWKDKTLRFGLVQRYFDQYNIGFNKLGRQGTLECKPYVRGFVSQTDQMKRKYILSLEGNDVATNLKWVLASNSVPIMPKPMHETWLLESQLVPYVHYIPLSDSLDDLDEVYEWCLNNDDHCKQIAENGKRYMEMFFDEENEKKIMKMIYERYCDLLRK